jgi:hypothetical protein
MACTAGSAECVIHLGGPSRENPSCGDCVSTAKTTLHQANENSRRVNKDRQAQNHVVTLELLWFRGVEICKKGLQNPSRLDDLISKPPILPGQHRLSTSQHHLITHAFTATKTAPPNEKSITIFCFGESYSSCLAREGRGLPKPLRFTSYIFIIVTYPLLIAPYISH